MLDPDSDDHWLREVWNPLVGIVVGIIVAGFVVAIIGYLRYG